MAQAKFESYGTGISVAIVGARFARPVVIPPNARKVRLVIRFEIYHWVALGSTPRFALGLGRGTTNLIGDATTDEFIGLISTAANWSYNGSNFYSTGITLAPHYKNGAANTYGTNYSVGAQIGGNRSYFHVLAAELSVASAGLWNVRAFYPRTYNVTADHLQYRNMLTQGGAETVYGGSWAAEERTVAGETNSPWSNRSLQFWWNNGTYRFDIEDVGLAVIE